MRREFFFWYLNAKNFQSFFERQNNNDKKRTYEFAMQSTSTVLLLLLNNNICHLFYAYNFFFSFKLANRTSDINQASQPRQTKLIWVWNLIKNITTHSVYSTSRRKFCVVKITILPLTLISIAQFQSQPRSQYQCARTYIYFIRFLCSLSRSYHIFCAQCAHERRKKQQQKLIRLFLLSYSVYVCSLSLPSSRFSTHGVRFFSHVSFLFSILWTFHFSLLHAIFLLGC